MANTNPKKFDAAASARVDRIYQNPDIIAQRKFVRSHLALKPGETVLDVGAGPGLLALEMAADVGPDGKVIALDPSTDMRTIAEDRCADAPNIVVTDGDAVALPAEENSLDAIVATQVYEYVPDIEATIRDAYRALKPGGRLLALDTDWNSAVINTSDQNRMQTILTAWRSHFVHPDLPGRLPKLMRDAGFTLNYAGGTPVVNTSLGPGQYAGDMIETLPKFAERRGGVDPEICESWLKEQQHLAANGRFFFSITRFMFIATKPL